MPVKVLIVDDSSFFRNRIADLLEGDARIKVVGTAANGREAIEQVKLQRPDVVTMDVEMPEMNGIDALRTIMQQSPVHVIMLSSLTHEGARISMQALEAGAADCIPKDLRQWMGSSSDIQSQLREQVVALGKSQRPRTFNGSSSLERNRSPLRRTERKDAPLASDPGAALAALRQRAEAANTATRRPEVSHRVSSGAKVPDCKVVVIGSSTGGPAALQKILTRLPAAFPYPIMLVQHMPSTFTPVFAERLNQQCNINVKEAEDGDRMVAGTAYLAPGGKQLIIDPKQSDRLKVMPGDERLTYKPSVDVSYASAAKSFGDKVLAVILTGMGSDGTDGARLLKRSGATVWAQDENSSTIYGMPKSVIEANLADSVLDLDEIGTLLSRRGER
ncbi:chemotaxis response regulator protein-glutamate methylesterase [Pontibacterium granulatum]|nr:chemotaxis response regulator protein-glutamate methylesterase [Pontibacterium granulatum]MDI3322868.1 chemotaxis response regulator protein-glutamate methylesterase [Pontibacterium granulatum]